jgi:signal transduction histidine kinase
MTRMTSGRRAKGGDLDVSGQAAEGAARGEQEPPGPALVEHNGRWTYAPIILMAVIGVTVTWLVFAQITDLEQQRRLSAFSEAARDRLLVVQRELAYALGMVQDIGGFFEASRSVTRRQFREFVGPALRRNSWIQALAWVPRVEAEEREDFLARARRSFPPFRILEMGEGGDLLEAAERPVHYPVLYVQPYTENRDLLGLDVAASSQLLGGLADVAASVTLRVSDPRPLPESSGARYGLTVAVPVFERGDEAEREPGAEDTGAEVLGHGTAQQGFAIGIFRVGQLVEQALSNLGAAGVDMRFYTAVPTVDSTPFYIHSSRARFEDTFGADDDRELVGHPAYIGEIPVGDRIWSVVCNPVPGYFEPDYWSSRLILGGGLAFTVLACVYLFTMIGRAQEVRRLVAQRTLELERTNAALNKEIADRRRAERALQMLNITLEHRVARRTAEAERRARDLEQFAYVASHDLKAPLRGISNLAGWLKEDLKDKLTPETAEQLGLLRDRVARMHALVEGVLAYSRIGRAEGAVEDVDTAKLVADTVDSIAPPSGFRVEVAPGMPRLFTDRLHLGQVFANLIGNAIHHHDRDHGVVRVSGRDLGERCEFQVADDGPGILPEHQDKVFLMFQTLTVKDSGGNTGIGLALVKKLVEEHGGTITLSSEGGRGSRFDFTWLKQEKEQDSFEEANAAFGEKR